MPRRRHRPTDPLIRDRNQLEILGAPGLAGLSRVGGRPGGTGGSNIVIRGGGEGPGTQIEHVTLSAQASQTIASGGAGVTWDQVAGAPTEVRGFATLQDELSSTGAVVAIPVNLTGRLLLKIRAKWGDYPDGFKCAGDVVITRTRDGDTATKTITVAPATRRIKLDDIAWSVKAGDTITVTLPNGSGADQTLEWAEVSLDITGVASPTSDVPVPTAITVEDFHIVSSDSSTTLGDSIVIPNLAVGDMMFVWGVLVNWDGADPIVPPSGWTEIEEFVFDTATFGTPQARTGLWWKIADAADVAGFSGWTNGTMSGSATRRVTMGGVRVPGGGSVVQWDRANDGTTAGGSSTAPQTASLTGVASTSKVVAIATGGNGETSTVISGGDAVQLGRGGGLTAWALIGEVDDSLSSVDVTADGGEWIAVWAVEVAE